MRGARVPGGSGEQVEVDWAVFCLYLKKLGCTQNSYSFATENIHTITLAFATAHILRHYAMVNYRQSEYI